MVSALHIIWNSIHPKKKRNKNYDDTLIFWHYLIGRVQLIRITYSPSLPSHPSWCSCVRESWIVSYGRWVGGVCHVLLWASCAYPFLLRCGFPWISSNMWAVLSWCKSEEAKGTRGLQVEGIASSESDLCRVPPLLPLACPPFSPVAGLPWPAALHGAALASLPALW